MLKSKGWHAEDFDRFEFVSDFEVNGLQNHYHNFGMGVPLIAVRGAHEEMDPAEQFYPPDLSFPLTAFLRLESASESAGGQVARHQRPRRFPGRRPAARRCTRYSSFSIRWKTPA